MLSNSTKDPHDSCTAQVRANLAHVAAHALFLSIVACLKLCMYSQWKAAASQLSLLAGQGVRVSASPFLQEKPATCSGLAQIAATESLPSRSTSVSEEVLASSCGHLSVCADEACIVRGAHKWRANLCSFSEILLVLYR